MSTKDVCAAYTKLVEDAKVAGVQACHEYVKAFMDETGLGVFHVHCFSMIINENDLCGNVNRFPLQHSWELDIVSLMQRAKDGMSLPEDHILCRILDSPTIEDCEIVVEELQERLGNDQPSSLPWETLFGTNQSILFVKGSDGEIKVWSEYRPYN